MCCDRRLRGAFLRGEAGVARGLFDNDFLLSKNQFVAKGENGLHRIKVCLRNASPKEAGTFHLASCQLVSIKCH